MANTALHHIYISNALIDILNCELIVKGSSWLKLTMTHCLVIYLFFAFALVH